MLFFVPIAILIAKGLNYFSYKRSIQFLISIFTVLALIAIGHATFIRNFAWKTEESLWLDAVEKNPNLSRPHINLGKAYAAAGLKQMALDQYKKALELPDGPNRKAHYLVHYSLGLIYESLEDHGRAEKHFLKALELEPRFPHTEDMQLSQVGQQKDGDCCRGRCRRLRCCRRSRPTGSATTKRPDRTQHRADPPQRDPAARQWRPAYRPGGPRLLLADARAEAAGDLGDPGDAGPKRSKRQKGRHEGPGPGTRKSTRTEPVNDNSAAMLHLLKSFGKLDRQEVLRFAVAETFILIAVLTPISGNMPMAGRRSVSWTSNT